jgi:hypothetical protein
MLLSTAGILDGDFPEPLGAPDHRLPIFRPDEGIAPEFDGMLGQAWFADRIWTFDYPSQRLLMHRTEPPPEVGVSTAQLGFLTDSTGTRVLSFPRITVVVDGDALDLLFDTGATIELTAAAQQQMSDPGPAARGTSFITTEVLNRWRERHPEWRVILDADETVADMAMIEVPEVSIAGLTVGPVWFTERPNANFHEYMSQWMDRRPDGALGGNALRFFRITLDYPAAVAHFLQTEGSA